MQTDSPKTVCFVGAGQMGCFNSLLAGSAGHTAKVFDISAVARDSFSDRQRQLARYVIERGLLDDSAADRALRNVRVMADAAEAAADADLLSESVPERLELKRQIHQQFDAICPAKTVFTTNTSTLLVSEIEDSVTRGDRFAALHSNLGTPLFDIVGGARTAPSTIAFLEKYVESLGGKPMIHAKQRRGYLSNTLFGALNSKAMLLVIQGCGSITDVDRAWMFYEQVQAGPFGILDFVGLDVALDVVVDRLRYKPNDQESEQLAAFLRGYTEQGHLGAKSSQGFYTYPDPEFQRPDFISSSKPAQALHLALVRRLIAAGMWLVIGGYASASDVDFTWNITNRSLRGPFGMLKAFWREILWDELLPHAEGAPSDDLLDKFRALMEEHARKSPP